MNNTDSNKPDRDTHNPQNIGRNAAHNASKAQRNNQNNIQNDDHQNNAGGALPSAPLTVHSILYKSVWGIHGRPGQFFVGEQDIFKGADSPSDSDYQLEPFSQYDINRLLELSTGNGKLILNDYVDQGNMVFNLYAQKEPVILESPVQEMALTILFDEQSLNFQTSFKQGDGTHDAEVDEIRKELAGNISEEYSASEFSDAFEEATASGVFELPTMQRSYKPHAFRVTATELPNHYLFTFEGYGGTFDRIKADNKYNAALRLVNMTHAGGMAARVEHEFKKLKEGQSYGGFGTWESLKLLKFLGLDPNEHYMRPREVEVTVNPNLTVDTLPILDGRQKRLPGVPLALPEELTYQMKGKTTKAVRSDILIPKSVIENLPDVYMNAMQEEQNRKEMEQLRRAETRVQSSASQTRHLEMNGWEEVAQSRRRHNNNNRNIAPVELETARDFILNNTDEQQTYRILLIGPGLEHLQEAIATARPFSTASILNPQSRELKNRVESAFYLGKAHPIYHYGSLETLDTRDLSRIKSQDFVAMPSVQQTYTISPLACVHIGLKYLRTGGKALLGTKIDEDQRNEDIADLLSEDYLDEEQAVLRTLFMRAADFEDILQTADDNQRTQLMNKANKIIPYLMRNREYFERKVDQTVGVNRDDLGNLDTLSQARTAVAALLQYHTERYTDEIRGNFRRFLDKSATKTSGNLSLVNSIVPDGELLPSYVVFQKH